MPRKKWASDPLLLAQFADGLTDGQNVTLVKFVIKRHTAMPRRAKRHLLHRIIRIGLVGVVGRDQPVEYSSISLRGLDCLQVHG